MAAATQRIIIHADDKTGAAIASAVRNTRKLDTQMKRTGDNFRNTTRQSRAHLGQLGHQVQDVAVQLQMGMNPLMVFGQQGSQVASIFGAKGALVGGLIAVAAVLAQQLIPNLLKANRAFDDLLSEIKGVGLELTDLPQHIINQQLENLARNVDKANEAFKEAKVDLSDANTQYALAEEKFKRLGFSGDELARALKNEKDAVDDAKDAVAEKTAEVIIATKAAANFSDELNKIATAEISPRVFGPTLFDGETRERLQAYRDQVVSQALPATQKFEIALNRLKMAAQEFGLTENEIAIETERLKESFFGAEKEVKKFGLTMGDVKNTGINSLENGLVSLIEGTKSVKDAFRDMASSVISSLIRMQIQQSITNPLATAMGIKRGAAIGGPIEGGKPYLVGEKGPEVMIPNGSGRMIPNNQLGGGGVTINQTVQVSTGVSQTVRAEITNLLPQITNAAKSAVADARQRGGGYSKALVGV